MTPEENDRLVEVVFYYFFRSKTDHAITDNNFWDAVHSICLLNAINPVTVIKNVRLLMTDENAPTEFETYYLLKNAKMSVRQINRYTGIYWQMQIAFNKKIETEGAPIVHRRVKDVVQKHELLDFLCAVKEFFGVLADVELMKSGAK